MKTLPLLCILAFSLAEGDISPEPNVVLQSVVLGKKPDFVNDVGDNCRETYTTYNDMNMVMRRMMHDLYPQSTRYKRNENSVEAVDDKTVDKLLDALDELKEDAEKNQENVKERDEDDRKSRLDQVCKRGGKWHKNLEECQANRRKEDIESYKKMLKENLDQLLGDNTDMEKKMKKLVLRKKDWKEELERRRVKDGLGESWPRLAEGRLPQDLYFPMTYHHQPSHHREYPTGGYLP